jgi:hypothetical protein
MNMISTGAFQTEMNASNKQPTLAKKFAAVWEKKNAKAARAGGVSLMALSLAACGSDDATTTATTATDTTTTTTTTTTTATPSTFDLTPLNDVASATMALNGSLTSEFRFTDGNEVVNGITATMSANDVLIDGSAADNDTLNVIATGTTAITTVKIETVNVEAASGTVLVDASALTGVTAINVSGTVASEVDNAAAAATIKSDGYGRIINVDADDYAGAVATSNPDSLNLEVAGGTWGATAGTQTGFSLTVDTGATIETVNVTSSGAADNTYNLDASTNATLSTVNFLGSADATARVAAGDVTGLTLDGTGATGSVSLRIDTNGTSAAVNATNFSGIDNFIMADSTVGSDNASIASLFSGAKITMADDFNGEDTTLTVKGATYSAPAASLSIVLDNETANTDVDMQKIDAQNVSALNIESAGFVSSSTAATAVNLINDLTGDASTITITGDTSLNLDANIDAVQTASTTTARAVTVDASAMSGTAFMDFAATANAKVSYTVTGTANNDTLVVNASGSTVSGGGGNDTITGGDGVDTIDGGAGKDHIDVSYGADVVTLGAGVDTVDIDVTDIAAVTEKQTITFVRTVDGLNADTVLASSVNGEVITFTYDTDVATSATKLADAYEVALKGSTGYANGDFTYTQAAGVLTLVFDNNIGDVADIKFWESGVDDVADATRTYLEKDTTTTTDQVSVTTADVANFTGSLAKDVDVDFTDFSSEDVLDVAGVASLGANYFEGAVADAADAANGVAVITDASYATAALAEDAIAAGGTDTADSVVIYLNSTSGNAEMMYVANLGTDEATEEVLGVFENITTLADIAATFSTDSFTIA